MKECIFIFVFILVTSCDGKTGSKKPTQTISTTEERQIEITKPSEETTPTIEPETPVIIAEPEPEVPVIIIADPERFPPEEKLNYDYSLLSEKGIHIEGKSILSELNYPAAIYCSNTKFLNSEKAEALKFFLSFLQDEETQCMDGVIVKTDSLVKLVKKSIKELENNAKSRFCPQIYLAIGSD